MGFRGKETNGALKSAGDSTHYQLPGAKHPPVPGTVQAFPRAFHLHALNGGTLIHQREHRAGELGAGLTAGEGWRVLSLAGYLLEVGNEADAQCPYLGIEEEAAQLTVGAR